MAEIFTAEIVDFFVILDPVLGLNNIIPRNGQPWFGLVIGFFN